MQIPPGATFQLVQYFSSSSTGRHLLQLSAETKIVSDNQVSVQLQGVGGYYYLTGGLAPVVNASTGKANA